MRFDGGDKQCKVFCGNNNQAVNVAHSVDQWVSIEVIVDLEIDVLEVRVRRLDDRCE